MKTGISNAMRNLGVLLGVLVISLTGVVYAGTAPSVEVLTPITEGLRSPVKSAVDSQGNIFVADMRAGGIVKFSKYGKQLQKIALASKVSAIAVTPNDDLLVAFTDKVVNYGKEGVAAANALVSGISSISAITVDASGSIYIADSGSRVIKKYTSTGVFALNIGTPYTTNMIGAFPGRIYSPSALAWEKSKNELYLVDMINTKTPVMVYDAATGAYKKGIGNTYAQDTTPGASVVLPLVFAYPYGITFEYVNNALNRVFVLDNASLQALDGPSIQNYAVATPASPITTTNTPLVFLSTVSTSGNKPGQIYNPTDMVYDSGTSRLIVANGMGNLFMIGIDGGKNPTEPVVEPPPVVVPPPVDPVLTALTIDPIPSLTKDRFLQVTGKTEAGAVVYVSSGIGTSVEAAVSGDSWSAQLSLNEGVNEISVSATRAPALTASKTVMTSLDTLAPVLTLSALPDGSYTSRQVQNISGSAGDANLASVTVNGQPAAVSSGTFSTAVALVRGANEITVVATDALGNTVTEKRTYNFDDTLPKIIIAAPVDNSATNLQDVVISGTVDKDSAVTVAGAAAKMNGSQWTATVRLENGTNTVDVVATDIFGNVSSDKRTITFDAEAPIVAFTAPAQDIAVNSPDLQIRGTVSDAANSSKDLSVTASVNGIDVPVTVTDGAFSAYYAFPAVDGKLTDATYSVAITVTDKAGNKSAAVRNVVLDTAAPEITLAQITSPYPMTLSGTVKENGVTISVADANGPAGKVTISGEEWSAAMNAVYDPSTLKVTASDAAANTVVKTIQLPVADGDMDADGKVTIRDAIAVLRLVVEGKAPTKEQLAHGDLGPLADGKVNADGSLDMGDVRLLLMKALGKLQ